jgi:aspartate/tyrosine/aromatic aminotransferase
MSLYGERCGALSVVCPDAAQAERVLGQLKYTVRRSYSSPPIYGGQIVARVLGDAELRPLWESEVAAMRERILGMRRQLHAVLTARLPGRDFGYFLSQRGNRLGRGALAQHHLGRIAGQQLQHREHDQRGDEQGGDKACKALQQEPTHAFYDA